MRTSELTGAALDWAVAKCEGVTLGQPDNIPYNVEFRMMHDSGDLQFSTDWAQGGPIIDREDIAISSAPDGLWAAYASKGTRLVQHGGQTVEVFNWTYKQQGYHPLIAAMRCYVASKLGDDVEIPNELTGDNK